ncbi:MAG TPA: hypothetical protein VGC37_18570 [Friedmanniella sp.]
MTTRTNGRRRAGAEWLWTAIVAVVVCVALAAIGYSVGPRTLGTLGVVGIVAPVLLALRWSRERRR